MKLEDITSRIEADARAKAEEIRSAARKQADVTISEANEEAARIREDAEKRAGIEKNKIISQREAVAGIDTRLLLLKAKRERMEDCFKSAEKKLLSMDRPSYYEFLSGIVRKSGISDGEIILSKRDQEDREAILEAVHKAVPGSHFTVSDEIGNFEGGLILRSGKMYANGTIENYIEEARKTMAKDVADRLFSENAEQ